MPLPLSKNQAIKSITWLKKTFGDKMIAATSGTPFNIDTLCGIACQETANVWLSWINNSAPDEILGLCVFDASGDFPGTQRSAFPKNSGAFRSKYGDAFANMLIDEANRSRKKRGFGPKDWVYKGYGIFQYDLQHILTDQAFFEKKKWHSFEECLKKVMDELKLKWKIHGDMWKTLKAYNGSGPRATEYANNVTIFINYSKEVVI